MTVARNITRVWWIKNDIDVEKSKASSEIANEEKVWRGGDEKAKRIYILYRKLYAVRFMNYSSNFTFLILLSDLIHFLFHFLICLFHNIYIWHRHRGKNNIEIELTDFWITLFFFFWFLFSSWFFNLFAQFFFLSVYLMNDGLIKKKKKKKKKWLDMRCADSRWHSTDN